MADTVKALVQRNIQGKPAFAIEQVPKPQPEPHQLLVKISHVAQNPTDVQSFDRNAAGDGSVFGCDFVGTVEELGASATRAKKGDVIAGLIRGGG
jgi:NADPH:quinone reductase-like Zn-dependent oxidoreductase